MIERRLLEQNGALVFGAFPAITPMVRLLFQQAGNTLDP